VLSGRRTACDYTRPGKPDIAWDDKAAKAVLIDGLVLDALALLDALTSTDTDQVTAEPTKDAPSDGRGADGQGADGQGADGQGADGQGADGQGEADEAGQALALLALLAGQDVEWIDDGAGGGRWRIAERVARDRIISTVDTETRRRRGRHRVPAARPPRRPRGHRNSAVGRRNQRPGGGGLLAGPTGDGARQPDPRLAVASRRVHRLTRGPAHRQSGRTR